MKFGLLIVQNKQPEDCSTRAASRARTHTHMDQLGPINLLNDWQINHTSNISRCSPSMFRMLQEISTNDNECLNKSCTRVETASRFVFD